LKRNLVQENIKEKIVTDPKDMLYSLSDFFDYGNYNAVKKAVSRLVADGNLEKVKRGMYKRPTYNEFIGETMAPSPTEVANKIAAQNRWTIVPSKDTALNALGLTTQVPATYSFITDGKDKEEVLGNGVKLTFKHVPQREITGMSYKSALVIEAIKAMGKDNIDELAKKKLNNSLTKMEKERLLKDVKTSRVWLAEEIRKLIEV